MDGFKIETDGRPPFYLLGEIPLALRQYVVVQSHGLTLIKMPTAEEIAAAELELEMEELHRTEKQIMNDGEVRTELRFIDGGMKPMSDEEAETFDRLTVLRDLYNTSMVSQDYMLKEFGVP